MSAKRRQSLSRVVRALATIKTAAEATVAASVAEGEEVDRERQLLIGTYNAHDGLHQTFAEALSKALRESSLKLAAVRDREIAERAELSKLSLRLKQAERLHRDCSSQIEEERQRHNLDAAIERPAQASGKRWPSK